MAQNVLIGYDNAVQAGLYGGVAPTYAEEDGTNGFGVRMIADRVYQRWFTAAFAGGSREVASFNSGHAVVLSVSNFTQSGFTFKNLVAGTYDAAIDAMFDRMYALGFDANVATLTRTIGTTNTSANITGTFTAADVGASITGTGIQASTVINSQTGTAAAMSKTATATGSPTASIIQGITQPFVYFILQHEVDRGAANGKLYGTDTTADWIAAWQRVWTRAGLRATAAGVPRTRVRFCWNVTAYGADVGRLEPYYPGNAYVDVLGFDEYTGPSVSSFTAVNAHSLAYARSKGKPMCIPEFANISTDSSTVAAWYTDVATQINAITDITYEFICFWAANVNAYSNYYQYNINKVADTKGNANPLKHAAIAGMITSLGGNPIRTGTSQALPSVATGVTVTSSTDGQSATMTWTAPPGGDNVTGWDAYLAAGNTNVLGKKNTSTLAATPLSYTFTGLTPGTLYSADVVAINSAGRSGFGTIATFTTSTPGATNHAPNITTFTATPQTGNPQAVDFLCNASDPDSNPITETVTVSAPTAGFSETFTLTNNVVTTRNYTFAGPATATVAVADNGTPPLVTSATATFSITLGSSLTKTQQWNRGPFLPGADPRGVGKGVLGFLDDLDADIGAAQTAKSNHNVIHGLVGSSFDPINCGGTNVYTAAAGQLIWAALLLQDVVISGVVLLTSVAQIGTGSQLGLHNSQGALMIDSAGNSTTYSGTSVDAFLTNTTVGSQSFTLPAQITQLPPQTVVYVSLFTPATTVTTYPQIRTTSAGSVEAKVNLTTQPRYGLATGQTGIVDPIPFGSWSASSPPWFVGLF